MTTAADLINETKRYLLSGYSEPLNKLNGDIDAETTTITLVNNIGGIQAGSYLSVNLEIMYVWSATGNTATVQRGMNGSVPAVHLDGTLVTLDPKFPDFNILQAINNDLLDLSGRGLFRVSTVEFDFVAGTYGYNLNVTSIISGIEARYNHPGNEHDWPQLRQWKIRRNSNLTDFPSGFSFILAEEAHPGYPILVTYSAPYSPLTGLQDNVEATSGLQPEAHDIPALGAALRLQVVREPQRNFNEAQPNSRRSDEVREGAQINAANGFVRLREMRINSFKTLLNKMYPNRRSIK